MMLTAGTPLLQSQSAVHARIRYRNDDVHIVKK